MLHVSDVQVSADFYAGLGMELLSRFGPEGEPYWAHLGHQQAHVMFTRAGGPVNPRDQAVVLYLYSTDLEFLRETLIGKGVANGGKYLGESEGEFPRSGMLFDITAPHYMPRGEMRVHDPDGYVLLIGQTDPTESE